MMKGYIFFLGILLGISGHIHAQEMDGFVQPRFPGGNAMLQDFINHNLKFPDRFQSEDFYQLVTVYLEIDETGKILNPTVNDSVPKELKNEALRLASLIEKFEPATSNGDPVKSHYELNIEFKYEAYRYIKGGRLDFSDFRKLLDKLPDNEACDLGRKALFDGDHATSLALLNKCLDNAILMAGERAASLYYRSIVHLVLKDTASFFQDIDAAIGLGGSWYIDAYLTRADMYKSLGKYFLAVEDYDKALIIDGKSLDAFIGRGYCKYAQGFYEDAREDFEKAIKFHPDNSLGYKNLGILNLNRKEFSDCTSNLTKAIQLGDEAAGNFFQRGMCYGRNKNIEMACRDWTKAQELGVKDAELLVNSQCLGKY